MRVIHWLTQGDRRYSTVLSWFLFAVGVLAICIFLGFACYQWASHDGGHAWTSIGIAVIFGCESLASLIMLRLFERSRRWLDRRYRVHK